MSIAVQHDDFDFAAEYAALRNRHRETGAIVSFVGLVRDFSDAQTVQHIELEHYPGMCENVLAQLVEEATERWQLLGARIVHRIGKLHPGDQIVLVLAAAPHRADAFSACEFMIDALKTRAPFWKKQTTTHGSEWLATKTSDQQRAARWNPEDRT
ncbi:MAG: molybdenum cofactor biosynthesis protein MoaE [Pseudomonadota bacterium]